MMDAAGKWKGYQRVQDSGQKFNTLFSFGPQLFYDDYSNVVADLVAMQGYLGTVP